MSWLDAFFSPGPSPTFPGTVTAGVLSVGGAASVGASLAVAGGFGCNGAVPQGPITVDQVTDSTGGTPGSTLPAIAAGSSYTQADMQAVRTGLASLAAETNALQAALSLRGGGVGVLA
jgi:ATP-dependent protease ClpP protease subunit